MNNGTRDELALLVPLDNRKLATPSIDHSAASDAKFSGGPTTARYERFVLCIVKRRPERERQAMLQCTLFAVSVRQSKKTVRIVICNCKRGEAEPSRLTYGLRTNRPLSQKYFRVS